MNSLEHVGYHKTLDLREHYPVSWRYGFRKCFAWLLAFLLILAVLVLLRSSEMAQALLPKRLDYLQYYLVLMAGLLVLSKFIYSELYRRSFYYGTEGFRLMVTRGVIIKEFGSLPLLPVSEIYIQRNLLDILLGLANVAVFTPMDQTRKFARIECLSMSHAKALQELLGEVLTTQVFLAPGSTDEPQLYRHQEQGQLPEARFQKLIEHKPKIELSNDIIDLSKQEFRYHDLV